MEPLRQREPGPADQAEQSALLEAVREGIATR